MIDERRYQEGLAQLENQAGQTEVVRDAVVNWFLKTSGIPDETGCAGEHPGCMEPESIQLEGYTLVAVNPWEAASGEIAVSCAISRCSEHFVLKGSPGRHEVRIRYFDHNSGPANFRILLDGQLLDQWVASDRLPTQKFGGASSSLRMVPGVMLKLGDEIDIEGSPDREESAALDYLEIQ